MANTRRRTQRTSRTRTRSTVARSTQADTTAADESRLDGRTVDWQNDFGYIRGDLRQLMFITVILFALLLVVGFFL